MEVALDHVHLFVGSPADAAAFFGDVLEATPSSPHPADPPSRFRFTLAGLHWIIDPGGHRQRGGATLGIEHVALRVDDLGGAVAAMRRRGAAVVKDVAEPRPGILTAFIEGPDGLLVELIQRGV